MSPEFIQWWCIGLVVAGLVCRYFYSRNQKVARIFMWVLLGIFLTPIGAVLVYLVLSAMGRQPSATSSSSIDTGTS